MKAGYVYILSNRNRTTFYIGVTSDLQTRIYQHHYEKGSKFTHRYNCHDLVYYEYFEDIVYAIDREKQLKRWHRDWKLNLIRTVNPDMKDLSEEVDS